MAGSGESSSDVTAKREKEGGGGKELVAFFGFSPLCVFKCFIKKWMAIISRHSQKGERRMWRLKRAWVRFGGKLSCNGLPGNQMLHLNGGR